MILDIKALNTVIHVVTVHIKSTVLIIVKSVLIIFTIRVMLQITHQTVNMIASIWPIIMYANMLADTLLK